MSTHDLDAVSLASSVLFCRAAREQERRQYTKEVLAEWKANKREAAQVQCAAAASTKAAAKRRENEKRALRQRHLSEKMRLHDLEQARQQKAADEAAAANPPPLSVWSTASTRRPLTADRQAKLLERDQRIVQRRRAALQAQQEPQAERSRIQAKLAAAVSTFLVPCFKGIFVWQRSCVSTHIYSPALLL
jgi:hypothetical protein